MKGGAGGRPACRCVLVQPGIRGASSQVRGRSSPELPPWRDPNPSRTVLGCDGAVEIDEVRRLVTKTYLHPDRKTAIHNVRREVAYASRFREALADFEGVACPKVISWELSTPPRVVMALCPGTALSDLLWRMDGDDARIAGIASRIQVGLEVYVRLFDEPYYDFCFNNMLFDENSGLVTFLDFVIPARPANGGTKTPLEASLGWLVGCACYSVARPAYLFSPKAAYMGLVQAIMARFEGRVRRDSVYAWARCVFSKMRGSGGRLRRSYYRTVGALVFDSYLHRLQQVGT